MGQYNSVFLLSALSWALHMNKLTLAWHLTVTLAIMTNKSSCPLVRKGVKGDLGGAGDRIGISWIWVLGATPPLK
jgi:hypothetical protein